jgi:RNA polymerase sigma-70 factor (ECF subfamily)
MLEFSNEIVKQFIKGDESAFKVIFNPFYPRLYHFIHEYIPNDDLVENMVQDTFLILWKLGNELKEDTNINAWLYTESRNNCL